MISKEKQQELEEILKENYNLELDEEELQNFGNALVDYFEVLIKIEKDSVNKD